MQMSKIKGYNIEDNNNITTVNWKIFIIFFITINLV